MSEQFYLTLPSNSSYDYFPNNTVAEYVTKLPNYIELTDHWQVALMEVHYPHTFNNINGETFKFTLDPENTMPVVEASIRPGYYPNIKSLVSTINSIIGNKNKIKLSYDRTTRKVKIDVKNGAQLWLTEPFASILGFPHATHITKVIESSYAADINIAKSSLYIYCDIVEPQIVGDTTAPLLRIVQAEGQEGVMITKSFQNPLYVPVGKRSFDSLEISIRDDTGMKVPFCSGRSICTLHFKRSESSYIY